MDTVQTKLRAIQLRESGFSYNEILKEIHVPKSTLAYWLRGLELDPGQKRLLDGRILDKQKKGRFMTAIALRARRVYREKIAYDEAEKEFGIYVAEPLFIIGTSLYWAEGGKRSGYFQFVNSDPEMIILMIQWIERYLKVSRKVLKYRLFIHEPYRSENLEAFWARNINVNKDIFQKTTYKPTHHLHKKNPNYKGCFRVNITNIATLRKVVAWQKLLIKYYKEVQVN